MNKYYIYKKVSDFKFMAKAIIVIITALILIFTASHIVSSKQNSSKTFETTNIIYKSVYINNDDTLWSIADKYYTDEFGSVRDYVNEIKRCNSLSSNTIYAGRYIVVPVYINPLY